MGNALVPELSVRDCARSLKIYRDVLGFEVLWQRPEEGFAVLAREGAEIMLDQIGLGRDFDGGFEGGFDGGPGGMAALGSGMNLQIRLRDVGAVAAAAIAAGMRIVLPMEDRWYRVDGAETGNRPFVVADPDGYLQRFYQDLGMRARVGY